MNTPETTMHVLAARAAITKQSERDRADRLGDDFHDLLNTVYDVLEDAGIALPDPNDPETARTAWM